MRAAGPAIIGLPVGVIGGWAGLSPWLVAVVVGASLIIGLVRAVFPQNSADRLHLLFAIRRSGERPIVEGTTPRAILSRCSCCPQCSHAGAAEITVTGQLVGLVLPRSFAACAHRNTRTTLKVKPKSGDSLRQQGAAKWKSLGSGGLQL